MNTIPVFLLTYRGIDYLDTWFKPENYSERLKFYILDNGRQTIPDHLKSYVVHVTEQNIGCAGGYNLMMDIGFRYFNYPKVILAQDDGKFTEEDIVKIYEVGQDKDVIGLFGNGFTYAIVAMPRETIDAVGRWDENYIYARREDNDFTYRCSLQGIRVGDLDQSSHGNVSVIPDEHVFSFHDGNVQYYYEKWGNPEQYQSPFNNPVIDIKNPPITQRLKDIYGDITEYPSQTEFRRFLESRTRTRIV